jgi:hypothetical protein
MRQYRFDATGYEMLRRADYPALARCLSLRRRELRGDSVFIGEAEFPTARILELDIEVFRVLDLLRLIRPM